MQRKAQVKIDSLEVHHFRGILDFKANLGGKSLVITGANGTGKSGIIDAIDFLFSGEITRLTGEGTGDISLDKHGPHIDKGPNEAFVQAEVILSDDSKMIVKRALKKKKLELISGDSEKFKALEEKFEMGQYLLSRRELLNFIACDGGKRSASMQSLLDLREIEKVRKELQSLQTKITGTVSTNKLGLNTDIAYLDATLKPSVKEWPQRLEKINELRFLLKAKKIEKFEKADVLEGVAIPERSATTAVTKKVLEDALQKLKIENTPLLKDHSGKDVIVLIFECVEQAKLIADFQRKIETHELVKMGLSRVGSKNICPLCDTDWKDQSLADHLRKKKELSESASELDRKFSAAKALLTQQCDSFLTKVKVVKGHLDKIPSASIELKSNLDNWVAALGVFKDSVKIDSEVDDLKSKIAQDSNRHLEAPAGVVTSLESLKDALPEESEEEKAYRDLTSCKNIIDSIRTKNEAVTDSTSRLKLISTIKDQFDTARSELFDSIYKEIEKDFGEYYRFLNEEDESSFEATLTDQEKSLDLKVDFFKRGKHPPNALHSEGHQDSMGICIYFSLMNKLKGSDFSIALFDDVMMSIDTGHRKKLCELILKSFSNVQFIITTHDPIWADYLKVYGVVPKDNVFKFRTWTLETGPIFDNKDMWEQIELKVEHSVKEAAASLRAFMEQEFHDICGGLRAPIPYNAGHSWHLGEFKAAAFGAFGRRLKEAKTAAISWKNEPAKEKIEKIEANYKEKLAQAKLQDWEINPLVHFNQWANFSKQEFKSTLSAMKELVHSFKCEACERYISLTTPAGGHDPTATSCVCGDKNFTLVKDKSPKEGTT